MNLNGTTVSPDTRKGLVFMKLEDSLLHFCWKDRSNGQIEDDFIIFPGDAEIKPITQCKTGRVILLKFKENNRKYFYWLQEPKDDKDEEYVKKVNNFIDNPDSALASANADISLSDLPFPMASQLQNMSQQQLLELLAMRNNSNELFSGRAVTGRGESEGGQVETAPSESSQQQPQRQLLQLGDLQSALEQVLPQPSNESEGGPAGGVSLRDVLTPDALRVTLADVDDINNELAEYIPHSDTDVVKAITNPQFQQALGVFSSALSSGQLGPLMYQFGLSEMVATAAATGSVEKFAEALEEETKDDKS
jgi:hypothetical protein